MRRKQNNDLTPAVEAIPLSTEYAIREAVALLRASRKHFKSRDVAQAAELLEMVLADLPERKSICAPSK